MVDEKDFSLARFQETGVRVVSDPDDWAMCFGIKDFYGSHKEFSRGFDFSKYWDEFVEPLDERFPKWKYLKETGTGELELTARLLPKLRDCCDGKYSVFKTEVFKVVLLCTSEWVIVETFITGPDERHRKFYDVVQFHRVLNKLFKNKEISAEEAIEELKKWTFEPIKVEVFK